ncbi:HEAT repeat domain-containing protein, partial [Azospirillum sp. B4]|uniref:HEAT repeat domain-containing protein n=1 Tax=Azospirillum sp. B4 TaxID=95605 RepID=UPI0019008EEA
APLSKALPLIAEAGRRRLAAAVPLLGLRLKRLAGYGLTGREPVAVLEALAAIGGPQATAIVAGLLGGAGLAGAVEVAALGAAVRLEVALDRKVLLHLLGTTDAAARAAACRCVRQAEFPVIDALERLRADPDRAVATGAVCALGRLGRPTVRADLAQLVTAAPTRETVAALASVMDHVGVDGDGLVALRRAARLTDLREMVLEALDGFDDPQATAMAGKLRQQMADHVAAA